MQIARLEFKRIAPLQLDPPGVLSVGPIPSIQGMLSLIETLFSSNWNTVVVKRTANNVSQFNAQSD